MKYKFELTDTFGGEANYSWVRRGTVSANTLSGAIRKAKAETGIDGVRCRKESFGDSVALYPAGSCEVLFVELDCEDWKPS